MATAIPKACLASSAIRCRDVETGPNLGVLAVFPSTGATCRCPLPSTGLVGSIPPLRRYYETLRLLAVHPVPTENLIRTVRVTDRTDVGPANDGNVSIADVHSVNVDEWLASFGRSSGRHAACTVFRRRPSMAVVRPRDDGSCGAGRPRAASP